ncbi:MAG: hypothetical protein VX869_03315, partial [Chloroflexota bacterium]|nr:hypothetical protein [Chloroflexota bacterium]
NVCVVDHKLMSEDHKNMVGFLKRCFENDQLNLAPDNIEGVVQYVEKGIKKLELDVQYIENTNKERTSNKLFGKNSTVRKQLLPWITNLNRLLLAVLKLAKALSDDQGFLHPIVDDVNDVDPNGDADFSSDEEAVMDDGRADDTTVTEPSAFDAGGPLSLPVRSKSPASDGKSGAHSSAVGGSPSTDMFEALSQPSQTWQTRNRIPLNQIHRVYLALPLGL